MSAISYLPFYFPSPSLLIHPPASLTSFLFVLFFPFCLPFFFCSPALSNSFLPFAVLQDEWRWHDVIFKFQEMCAFISSGFIVFLAVVAVLTCISGKTRS